MYLGRYNISKQMLQTFFLNLIQEPVQIALKIFILYKIKGMKKKTTYIVE